MKLSRDSEILENFINNFTLKKFSLSESNVAFIKRIYDLLFECNKHDLSKIKEYFASTNTNSFDIFDKSLRHIQQDIKLRYNKQFNFEFTIGRRKFSIRMFFSNTSIKTECIGLCRRRLKYIYCWLFIANTFARTPYGKELTINIIFSDHKKMKPSEYQTFEAAHVNTAYTYACQTKTNIIIFRQEEWFKVLIHETFHSLGLDFVCMDNSLIEAKVATFFPIKKHDIRVYETYCEIWAEIINVIFVAFFGTRDKQNYQLMVRKMNKMLSYEVHFSLFQLNKVLETNGFSYMDLKNERKLYKENTYVLSYFILKGVIMSFMNIFIEWCNKENNSILFKKSQHVLNSFGNLIEKLHTHPVLLQNIERIQKMKSNHPFIDNTMRMSLYEMG